MVNCKGNNCKMNKTNKMKKNEKREKRWDE